MNELVTQESRELAPRTASPFDGDVAIFRSGLARRGENRKSLIDWVRTSLVDGVDYGRIHTKKKAECPHRGPPGCTPEKEPYHWSKNTLFKPGAEKICGMLGVNPTFPTIKDYEQAALAGTPIESIILRCHILSQDGAVIADGVGARSVAQDYGNLNTALKMACKSAHIDATLRMAGLSEIFTQDLEDIVKPESEPPASAEQQEQAMRQPPAGGTPGQASPSQTQPKASSGTYIPGSNAKGGKCTDKQAKLIEWRMGEAHVELVHLTQQFGFHAVADVPFAKVNEVLGWISSVGQ